MFTALLEPYKKRILVEDDKKAEFKAAEDDVKNRKDIQEALLGGLNTAVSVENAKVFKGRKAADQRRRRDEQVAKLRERIRLVTAQKKFTQGAQELATELKELVFLQELATKVGKDKTGEDLAAFEKILNELTTKIAEVRRKQATLAAEHLESTRARSAAANAGLAMPPEAGPYDKNRDTPVVLALQQEKLLEMQTHGPKVAAALAPGIGSPGLAPPALARLKAQHDATGIALIGTLRLSAAYALALDCTKLQERHAAQKLALQQAADARTPQDAAEALSAEARADLLQLPLDVAAMADTARKRAQKADIDARRTAEQQQVKDQADTAVDGWLTRPLDTTTPTFVRNQLDKPAGQKLLEMRRKVTKLDVLEAQVKADADNAASRAREEWKKIEEGADAEGEKEKKRKLVAQALALAQGPADVLNALRGSKMNELVQNYFRLVGRRKPGDALVNDLQVSPGTDRSDTAFLAATNSAQGDYNDRANIGKYTYHLTALANILRAVGAGISATGLSPSQGGLSGGSCDLADVRKDFHGTDIKKASVVNSQNKVASSSNREGAMKVYIKQREDAADKLMEEAVDARKASNAVLEAEKAAKAAQESSVMLRFPLRAEYIGKFDKDPIHLTANLALLDGTPVPPEDIEMLVHHNWVLITADNFQDEYRAMFGLPKRT